MSEESLNIEIDGRPLNAAKGQMIIQVADQAGIPIPRFCYHKKLSIAANCRMCLVEVEKMGKPVPACATPVMDGMKVRTRSPLALEAQRGVMEFLLINHPLDCPICDQGGECELQDLAMGYGSSVSRYTEKKRVVADEDIGPLVSTDMTRCIHCTRCVRFGDEVAGLRELGATGRGEEMRIGTYVKHAMSSELSGNVIDLCPVGALNNKPYRHSARAWEMLQHPAIGPHDCVGSNLYLHTLRNQVKRAVPRENETVNESWLADRDRFSCHALNSNDRLVAPQIKQNGAWQTVEWDAVLDAVSEKLHAVVKAHGPDALGALISPNATVEECYLLQKLVRGLGCNNIDYRLRQYDFSGDADDPIMPWLGMDIAELERLDAGLLIGTDVRKDQPLIAHRLRKAALQGAQISFFNHRHCDLNFPVNTQLVVSPEKTVAEMTAIVSALQRATGKTAPLPLKSLPDPAEISAECDAIAKSLLDGNSSAVILGVQASLHPEYSMLRALAFCIATLANARFGYLSAGANTAGASLAGVLPHREAGGGQIAAPGLNAYEMVSEARQAYLLFGVEPELESWDAHITSDAIRAANPAIVFSSFDSPALREYADIILPLAGFAETAGTFVNVEGRWQSFDAAVSPVGESRPGWKILRVLGNHCGLQGFDYFSTEEIRAEMQEKCNDIELSNTINHVTEVAGIPVPGDKQLLRIAEMPVYTVDPLVRRAEPLQQTNDARTAHAAALSSATAAQLGLVDAERVKARQNGTVASFPLRIDDSVPQGCVWLALGVPGSERMGSAFGPIEIEAD